MDFRKKDMINNINVIMIILMLGPLELSPVILGFGFKQFVEWVGCALSWLWTESWYNTDWATGLAERAAKWAAVFAKWAAVFAIWALQIEPETGRSLFPIFQGLHRTLYTAAAGICPRPAPPPSSTSRTSATLRKRGSHFQEKWQFYGPLTIHYPLYWGRQPHLGLKS